MADDTRGHGADAALLAPLARFGGAEPPAPAWFRDAIARAPERGFVESLGSKLELLTWGERGKPGLLLVHGNSAHADWWSFIAPFFAETHRVAAFSLAGMGASDWRERYSFDDFAADAQAIVQAAGLADAGPPLYVGHSFGALQVYYAAARHPERMSGAVLVDTGFRGPPPDELQARARRGLRSIPTGDRPSKVYPTLEAALARFRLMPPQPVENAFIADFIARRSLRRAPLPDGSGDGWTWRFDPGVLTKLDRTGLAELARDPPAFRIPLAHLFGENSLIVKRRSPGEPTGFPPGMPEIGVPDAHHHVMIDQPLALVAALRSLIAAWGVAAA